MSDQVPEGWEEKTLDAMVSVDGESLKGNTDPNFSFKYIDISCVSTGAVKPPTEQIMFKDAPSRAKRIVRRNDVLVATVRPNLKAFAHFDYEGDGWVASTGFAVLRHNEKSNSRFIYNTMLSDDVSKQIDRLVAGSNYPAINSSDIKELTLLSPPLNEQKKIASILTSVDEVIETTQKQIDKLQDLKKATMNELLTKGIGHTEFKDSELGRIPKSWGVNRLGDYVKLQGGNAFPSSEFGKIGIPVIRISNIKNGLVDLSGCVHFSESDQFERFIVFEGEILLAMSGATTGKIGVYKAKSPAYLNQRVGRFRIEDKKNVDSAFLNHLVQSEIFADATLRDAIGGAQPNISSSQVESVIYAFPTLSEQKVIASTLNSVDRKIDVQNAKLAQTQSLKKSLMQDLLTGKVRVQVN